MGRKDKIMGEIKLFLDKLRKKGLEINMKENKSSILLVINYINFEKQREILEKVIEENKIKKRHLKYISNLLNEYIKINIYFTYIEKKLNRLIELRNTLRDLYNEYDESKYLEKLRKEIYDKFNKLLEDLAYAIRNEMEEKRVLRKYLKYLNKEIDYDEEIKNVENALNDYRVRKKLYSFMNLLKKKVRKIVNDDNVRLFKIQNGIVLVMVYESKNFNQGWNYYRNKFYLVDLRNKKYIDITNMLKEKYYDKYNVDITKQILDRYGVYTDIVESLYNIDILNFLN
ncbi:MAG: hypothetical protein ACP5GJ_02430 [Nanopusillaceae archaeon]